MRKGLLKIICEQELPAFHTCSIRNTGDTGSNIASTLLVVAIMLLILKVAVLKVARQVPQCG